MHLRHSVPPERGDVATGQDGVLQAGVARQALREEGLSGPGWPCFVAVRVFAVRSSLVWIASFRVWLA